MINWKNVWELVKVNILYSNPQAVAALKRKQERKPNKKFSPYKSLLRQQAFATLVMLFVYGVMLPGINYVKTPAYLSLQLATFTIIALLYTFIALFSVFYDSKDTKLYLPLPLKSSEIYLAKLLSSQGQGLAFLSPTIAYLTIAFWQTNQSLLGPLVALVMFFILLLLVNAISLISLFFVGKLMAKSPYKKMISGSLMIIGFIGVMGLFGFLQATTHMTVDKQGQIFAINIPYFRGFYDFYLNPFSMDSIMNFWLGLVVLLGLGLFIYHRILPNYIAESLKMDATVVTKRQPKKTNKTSTSKQTLTKHHIATLKDTTLIMQNVLVSLLFVFMFIGPLLNKDIPQFNFSLDYFGMVLFVGFFLGMMISNPNSFLAVGMSLERENYTFIKTLPLDFKAFTRQKFWILAGLQALLPVLVYTGLGLYAKLPPLLILVFLIGMIFSSLVFGEWVYARDHRLLMLNWQNINQLFYRGGGQWLMAGLQLLVLMLFLVIMIASFALSTLIPPLMVSLALTFLVLGICLAIHLTIGRNFWKSLA